jgi:stage II sporulation protein D
VPRSVVSTFKALLQLAFLGLVGMTLYSCTARPPEQGRASLEGVQGPPVVRVALGKYFPAGAEGADIAVEGEYRIVSVRSGAVLHRGKSLAAAALKPSAHGLSLGHLTILERDVRFEPSFDGDLRVGDRGYRGALRALATDEKKLLLVNEVPMESYISGVLGAEMPLDYPRAALEAQAVAARTYALYEIRQAEKDGRAELWHVMDDTRSQVYAGTMRDTEKARNIVAGTRGVVLLSGGQVFCSYFHSTCGGHTEPADLFFPVPRLAPLSGRPCEFCTRGKWSSWEAVFTKKEVCARLGVGNVSGLRISEKAPGIHALRIEAGGRTWNGVEFRLAVGADRLYSTAFDVEDLGDRYRFRGRGYGHGVGMCQVGARGMADLGYDATEILRFYYPSSDLLRIYQ